MKKIISGGLLLTMLVLPTFAFAISNECQVAIKKDTHKILGALTGGKSFKGNVEIQPYTPDYNWGFEDRYYNMDFEVNFSSNEISGSILIDVKSCKVVDLMRVPNAG